MGGKLWGGRFSEKDMDAKVMAFTSSLDVDKVLAKYDCLSTKVHVEMLAKCGYISNDEKKQLIDVLEELSVKIKNEDISFEGHEDIHSAIQDYVEKKVPGAAKKMHTGRSRNEQVVNDVHLYIKDAAENISGSIETLQKELVYLAERSQDFIIPGYTHLNRAQPVLFSHLIMAYVEMLERDFDRILDAEVRADICVMGSGAIAGSTLKLDRKYVAEKLGFEDISANSIDAVSSRDFMAEFISALCFVSVHLSRMCEDLILYSTAEFGFIDIGSKYCTGSSLMPQKKNPDILELVRGRAGQLISALNTILILEKGLPHSYNRDLQEDKKPLFESVALVSDAVTLMAGVISSITLKKDGAVKALQDEFIYATDMAEYLVRKGVAFADAHKVIGNLVKHCVEKNINISDLSISELKGFSPELEEDVCELLNPETSVNNKKTEGSTNPEYVKKEIIEWKNVLKI